MNKTATTDMTTGRIFPKIVAFALPVIFSGLLQHLYNAADIIMVGQLVGSHAVAAVGATGSINALIVNMFVGLSVGTSVRVAAAVGGKMKERTSRLVHTSIMLALLCGVLMTLVGLFGARSFLTWMDTPADILDDSTLYLQIIFCGSLFSMLYNFGAAVLRAAGDSRRPFIYLAVSGLVNVVLNFCLVRFFNMGVAGVAVATVASQIISCVLVITALLRLRDDCRLFPSRLCFYGREAGDIFKTGLPACFQSVVFAISNAIIQSAVNSFEDTSVVAGNTAAANVEGFIYVAMNAFLVSTVTLVGQNIGAGKFERIKSILFESIALVTAVGLGIGLLVYIFGEQLLAVYLPNDPTAIPYGMQRTAIIAFTYFLCGIMETIVGANRGMGATVAPMLASIICVCGVRLTWIFTVFAAHHTLEMLFLSYPLSWIATIICQLVVFFITKKRIVRQAQTHTGLLL